MKLSTYSLFMIIASFCLMIISNGGESFGWFVNMFAWFVVNVWTWRGVNREYD